MTGEITLRGEVLPIGGLKEKLLAAGRGGIKTVLIPEENVKDLAEIPDEIKNRLDIRPGALDRAGAGSGARTAADPTAGTGGRCRSGCLPSSRQTRSPRSSSTRACRERYVCKTRCERKRPCGEAQNAGGAGSPARLCNEAQGRFLAATRRERAPWCATLRRAPAQRRRVYDNSSRALHLAPVTPPVRACRHSVNRPYHTERGRT